MLNDYVNSKNSKTKSYNIYSKETIKKYLEKNISKENSKKVTLIPIDESMILSDEDSQFTLDLLNKIYLFEEK